MSLCELRDPCALRRSMMGGDWSEPILPDTGGSQLPDQSGQGKCTATLTDVKPSCACRAMRLTSASLRGSVILGLIANPKNSRFLLVLKGEASYLLSSVA